MNDKEGKVCKSDEKNEEENDDDENLVQSKTSFVELTDELCFSQPSTSHGVLKDEQYLTQPSTSHSWLPDDSFSTQPNTFCAGRKDEPKWNTSTRQLYENNLKSSSLEVRGAGSHKSPDSQSRMRLPSIADSTSSDDSCVYMYKGEDGQRNGNIVNKRINSSSPEMDYLEMDFDPCQSNGQDSSDGSYSCDIVDLQDEERAVSSNSRLNPSESNLDERNITPTFRSPSPVCFLESNISLVDPSSTLNSIQLIDSNDNLNQQEDENGLKATKASNIPRTPESDNERETPEQNNRPQPLQSIQTTESDITCSEQNVFLKKHIRGTASQYYKKFENVPCCITTLSQAVNILISEGSIIEEVEEERNNIDMLIPELLLNLSTGYLTVSRVQEMIGKATNGAVLSKYFEANSSILLNLSVWLNYWLKKDAIVILSLNFHINGKKCTNVVNSSWHYHLIHGVNSNGIQMFSPMETIPEETLKKLFLNPSEVLIRKDCIMAHWTPTSNFKPLLHHPENSWKEYNVLGQIVNVIRDTLKGNCDEEISYVKVPSAHQPGILLMMHSDNVHLKNLVDADATFSPL